MYPVLFAPNAATWDSFGIGVLSSAISCEVEENRNGSYELEMEYPITGAFYADIALRSLIVAKPNYTDDPQPFRVYSISKPLNGIVTVNAQHISYDLSGYVDATFTAQGIQAALAQMVNANTVYPAPCPFTFSSDMSSTVTMTNKHPQSVRALMGGVEGSLIDTYGGEWHYNGYACTLASARGADRGVLIRYGKNLTDVKQEENNASVYTAVYPFYYNSSTQTLVTLTEKILSVSGTFDYTNVMPLDLTMEFESEPTEAALRTRAQSYITTNNIGVPKVNLTVSFQTLDSLAERVDLCDTVSVRFDALGVSATAKCIRTKWDVLKGRYIEVELGSARNSLAATIAQSTEVITEINSRSSQFQTIAKKITDTVTGNMGGYIMLHDTNNDGEPDEILILDHDDITTAVNVIRMNNSGIAFSKTGYTGTYTTAWNINGQFVADFIASGELDATLVKIIGESTTNTDIFYWDAANITIVNPSNTNQMIRLGKYDGTNYGLGFSTDAGATWKSGFTFTGIKFLYDTASPLERIGITDGYLYITDANNVNFALIGKSDCTNLDGTRTQAHIYQLGSWLAAGTDGVTREFWEAHGIYSFSAGRMNIPAGPYSICLGYSNLTAGNYSSTIGGFEHKATGAKSFLAGGRQSTASGESSSVIGGATHTASGISAFIGGGATNTASGQNSATVGGNTNVVSGNNCVLVGGHDNEASVANSVILGGNGNESSSSNTAIVGGYSSTINANSGNSVIAGGYNQIAGGIDSGIFCGRGNTTSAENAVVIGGFLSTASGTNSGIFCGNTHTASGTNAVIIGGYNCTASGQRGGVFGGNTNTASQNNAVVLGGYSGTASNYNGAVVGGYQNNNGGEKAAIVGGQDNTLASTSGSTGVNSVIAGGNANNIDNDNAFIGGGQSNNAHSSYSGVVGGSGNSASGAATVIVGGQNNTTTGRQTVIAGGGSNQASGAYSLGGGVSNVISGDAAFCMGRNNTTSNDSAATIGRYLLTGSACQFVCGLWNVQEAGAFIVGNGDSSTQTRANALKLTWAGNLTIAGTLTQSSDERLKDIAGEVPDVSGIRAVRFKWNDKKVNHDDEEHIGYIAQDVEKVAPFLVHENGDGYKTLNYVELLCAKIERLEQTVFNLTKRIEELEVGRNGD